MAPDPAAIRRDEAIGLSEIALKQKLPPRRQDEKSRGPLLPVENEIVQKDGQFVERQEHEKNRPFLVLLVEFRHVSFHVVNSVTQVLDLVRSDYQNDGKPDRDRWHR